MSDYMEGLRDTFRPHPPGTFRIQCTGEYKEPYNHIFTEPNCGFVLQCQNCSWRRCTYGGEAYVQDPVSGWWRRDSGLCHCVVFYVRSVDWPRDSYLYFREWHRLRTCTSWIKEEHDALSLYLRFLLPYRVGDVVLGSWRHRWYPAQVRAVASPGYVVLQWLGNVSGPRSIGKDGKLQWFPGDSKSAVRAEYICRGCSVRVMYACAP